MTIKVNGLTLKLMLFHKVNGKLLIVNRKSIHHLPLTIYPKVKQGFTLIELLVVISIIGILATFAVASFTSAQQKGRDSGRKADLDAVKKALELAKADTTGGAYYPACDAYVSGACNITGTSTNPDLSTTYIKTFPTDPKGSSWNYVYTPTPASCAAGACTDYTLRACLENANDPDKEGTKVGCTGTGQNASYMVQNP